MDLTDTQWQQIKHFIPEDPVRSDGRGRPWADQRKVLHGILWMLRSGAPWKDLPIRYGAYQTVHPRFTRWRKEGVIRAVLQGLAEDLHKRGCFDLSECFIDGSFAPAKKGDSKVIPQFGGRYFNQSGNCVVSCKENVEALAFLAGRLLAMPTIVLMTLWWSIGGSAVMVLAALQQIPEAIYEAASIDGAGSR